MTERKWSAESKLKKIQKELDDIEGNESESEMWVTLQRIKSIIKHN